MSHDGRTLVFYSYASNLVPDDTNNVPDVFSYDRLTKKTERLSIGLDGKQTSTPSSYPSISDNGRHVAFISATHLPDDNPRASCDDHDCNNVYVLDRQTKHLVQANLTPSGSRLDASELDCVISGNGRYVVFGSTSSTLSGSYDPGNDSNLFVRDLQTNTTKMVSVNAAGRFDGGFGNDPSISDDGRFIAFDSASKLLPKSTPQDTVYVRDMQQGVTSLVASRSSQPAISADGQVIAFVSSAKLAANDTNNFQDIYTYDLPTKAIRRVSEASNGTQTNNDSSEPAISGDGSYVVFTSGADNLVPADSNSFTDVFIRYRNYGITRRVDVASHDGAQALPGYFTLRPTISRDGKAITFSTDARNLVPGRLAQQIDLYQTYNPVVNIPYYDPGDFIGVWH
jgi:Tol biopolymer transport system component